MSSSSDSGVCPKVSRSFLEGFFLRLKTLPRSIRDVVVVNDSIDANGAKGEFVEPHISSVIYQGALRVRLRASSAFLLRSALLIAGEVASAPHLPKAICGDGSARNPKPPR